MTKYPRSVESSKGQSRRSWDSKSKRRKKKKKTKDSRIVEIKRVAKKWEIWDDKKEMAKSEMEVKKLILEKFHKWIKVFGKKQSKRICY